MGNLLSHVRFYDFSELAGTRYETLFDSIDGWIKETTGDGAIALSQDCVNVLGGINPGAYATLRKSPLYLNFIPDFSKKRLIRSCVYFNFKAGGLDLNYFCTGGMDEFMPGFGFHIKGDGLYAFASDGMDTTEVKVSADLTPPWDYSWILEAILFPNSHVQFKVNEIFVTSIYAYIPTGYDTLFNLLCYSAGQGGAVTHLLQAGNGLFFQDT